MTGKADGGCRARVRTPDHPRWGNHPMGGGVQCGAESRHVAVAPQLRTVVMSELIWTFEDERSY